MKDTSAETEFGFVHAAAVACCLLRNPEATAITFRSGRIFIDGNETELHRDWPVGTLQRQITRCLDHVGIQKSATHFLAVWATAFDGQETLSRGEVIKAAHLGSAATPPVLNGFDHWQREWNTHQRRVFSETGREWITQVGELPKEPSELSSHLHTTPVFVNWIRRILTHEHWTTVVSPLERMPNLQLADIWVELRLGRPTSRGSWYTGSGNSIMQPVATQELDDFLSVSPDQLVSGLQGTVAILGRPGSGKTTLLKWIVQYCLTEANGRFLLPIFIPLRQFSLRKRVNPTLTLLEFFLHQCGVEHRSQLKLWEDFFAVLGSGIRTTRCRPPAARRRSFGTG